LKAPTDLWIGHTKFCTITHAAGKPLNGVDPHPQQFHIFKKIHQKPKLKRATAVLSRTLYMTVLRK
jgi:hypothetical protein